LDAPYLTIIIACGEQDFHLSLCSNS